MTREGFAKSILPKLPTADANSRQVGVASGIDGNVGHAGACEAGVNHAQFVSCGAQTGEVEIADRRKGLLIWW
jgi:hypothetical protein